jgi:hypothetical protein
LNDVRRDVAERFAWSLDLVAWVVQCCMRYVHELTGCCPKARMRSATRFSNDEWRLPDFSSDPNADTIARRYWICQRSWSNPHCVKLLCFCPPKLGHNTRVLACLDAKNTRVMQFQYQGHSDTKLAQNSPKTFSKQTQNTANTLENPVWEHLEAAFCEYSPCFGAKYIPASRSAIQQRRMPKYLGWTKMMQLLALIPNF